jgi:nucleotide-binding universal stress UspA family protein
MLPKLAPGTVVDDFVLGERVHAGAHSVIFHAASPASEFPIIIKFPRIGPGHPRESLLDFETEATILPVLSGPHVPRFVTVGDIGQPYLASEWIHGDSLRALLAGALPRDTALSGAAIADALHSIHLQHVIHLDLKPDNIIFKPDGTAVIIDFGLAHHDMYPDLLEEEKRFAAGSAPYLSPEQVLDSRSDLRSDIFALGVVLYEMATGELPFGLPQTAAGLRDRLWRIPVPPSVRAADVTPWLQEIILRCLEIDPSVRYQSAADVAFDLRNPDQVVLTERAHRVARAGFLRQVANWWNARSQSAPARVNDTPIVMVAVDTSHPDDARHPELRRAVSRVLAQRSEYRLICVSVIRAPALIEGQGGDSASAKHLEHLVQLRHWTRPLGLPPQRLSLHVIESANAAAVLLDFARHNNVSLIVLGAPDPREHKLAWWRSVASGVTANAHCSVHVIRVPKP